MSTHAQVCTQEYTYMNTHMNTLHTCIYTHIYTTNNKPLKLKIFHVAVSHCYFAVNYKKSVLFKQYFSFNSLNK